MTELVPVAPRYSVVLPVGRRIDDLGALLSEYVTALDAAGAPFELIVVLDGPKREYLESLRSVAAFDTRIRVIELAKEFGESAALAAGFDAAQGAVLVTLPAYYQVDAPELPKLIAASAEAADAEMLIAVRWPRAGGPFDKLRRKAFHGLFCFISGMRYRDLACGVRLFPRAVADEVPLYGDQHRFLPALAARRGFRVREVELRQSPKDRFRGHYRLREYLHRFLDVLTVFFLVRFTKKPLRFFGTIGFIAAGIGGVATAIIVVQRLFFGQPLADRTALLLASLLVVLGVQTFALGLIGELIIFTHASGMKEYTIRRVIQAAPPASPAVDDEGVAPQQVRL
jgi:glycosyltransferase involved in cell wall biosynthesis